MFFEGIFLTKHTLIKKRGRSGTSLACGPMLDADVSRAHMAVTAHAGSNKKSLAS